jgi:predicted metal-dependent HD superfamily phosphohydrolase
MTGDHKTKYPSMNPLHEQLYHDALQRLGARMDAGWKDLLAELHGMHAGRPYHSWHHVEHAFAQAFSIVVQSPHPVTTGDWDLLALAIMYHDAVYESRVSESGKGNEERSADLMERHLSSLDFDPDLIAEIRRLILLTQNHRLKDPRDFRGAAMLDADLAILAAPAADYDAYAKAIREEYDWVEPEAYRVGRTRVLENFLTRPSLFSTNLLSTEQAHKNLRREIAALNPFPASLRTS